MSLNVTSWGPLREAIRCDLIHADVVLVQEHHLASDACDEARKMAARHGWSADFVPALATGNGSGTSGGVAILVRLGIGYARAEESHSLVRIPRDERMAFWHVGCGLRGGFIAGSLYLVTGQADGQVNQDLLFRAGDVLHTIAKPFVLGADWQMEPSLMPAGWLRYVGAKLVTSGRPTCTSAACLSEIDFFVMGKGLETLAGHCEVDDAVPVRPHRPVVVRLARWDATQQVKVLKRPKAIPIGRCFGPLQRGPDWSECLAAASQVSTHTELSTLTETFIETFEKELLGRHDLAGESGYTGRSRGPTFAWKHPMQATRGEVRVQADQAHWRWLADRVAEWRHLRARATFEGGARAATWWKHAHHIHVRLKKFCPPFASKPEGWERWRVAIRALPSASEDELDGLATWLLECARKAEASAAYQRSSQWCKWARQETETPGARNAFRWIKDPPPWVPTVAAGPWGVAGLQEDAEAKAKVWHELWSLGQGIGHFRWHLQGCDIRALMPTQQQLTQCALSFPCRTALGVDNLHPRHFADISAEAYQALINVWVAMLEHGWVPEPIAMLLVILLPKPDGGLRPIGLFAGLTRVLMHWLRDTIGNEWARSVQRPYWYGARGKTVQRCVWAHAMAAEHAKARGECAASVLVDIQKAYENIRYSDLWAKAVRHKFPLHVLRLLLTMYSMTRMVKVGNVATAPFSALNSVAAGCQWADLLMKLSLIDILDDVVEAWPSTIPAVVADDVQLLATGPERQVVYVTAGAFKVLAAGLERAHLPLAVNKLCLLATSPGVCDAIGKRDHRLRRAATPETRNLGMDYACGRTSRHSVKRKRLAKVRKWVLKIRRLRKAGGKVRGLVTQGVLPATTFGVSVTGAPWHLIAAARTLAHRSLYTHTARRNVTVDLALAGRHLRSVDPAYHMMTGPILALSSALWEDWVPRGWVLRTWTGAWSRLAEAKAPWKLVEGPLSAALASAARLGWDAPSVGILVSRTGIRLDLLADCPATVHEVAMRDAEDYLLDKDLDRQTHLKELGGRPWLAPLRALLNARPTPSWTPQHQGTLRAIAANGLWTQDRLQEIGLVEDPSCQACGAGAGLWHRAWDCPAQAGFLAGYGLPDSVRAFARSARHLPLWTHALLPDPRDSLPLPVMTFEPTWDLRPEAGCFDGPAWGDGSAMKGQDARMTRAGWAVVQVERRGVLIHLTACLSGPLPGPVQSSPAAEAFGLWAYLKHCGLPPYQYHTDCQWVVNSWRSGSAACTGAQHVHADLWRKIWLAIDDLGGPAAVQVTKVKAHSSRAAVLEGRVSAVDKAANDFADAAAKTSTARHPQAPLAEARCARTWHCVTMVAKYLARVHWRAAEAGHDTTSRSGRLRPTRDMLRFMRACRPSDHRLFLKLGRWRCAHCWRSALTHAAIRALPCRTQRRHRVHTTGSLFFCWRCGAYSRKKARLLLIPCRGRPPRGSHGARVLGALAMGCCPISGEPIDRPFPAQGLVVDQLLPGALDWESGRRRLNVKTRLPRAA